MEIELVKQLDPIGEIKTFTTPIVVFVCKNV